MGYRRILAAALVFIIAVSCFSCSESGGDYNKLVEDGYAMIFGEGSKSMDIKISSTDENDITTEHILKGTVSGPWGGEDVSAVFNYSKAISDVEDDFGELIVVNNQAAYLNLSTMVNVAEDAGISVSDSFPGQYIPLSVNSEVLFRFLQALKSTHVSEDAVAEMDYGTKHKGHFDGTDAIKILRDAAKECYSACTTNGFKNVIPYKEILLVTGEAEDDVVAEIQCIPGSTMRHTIRGNNWSISVGVYMEDIPEIDSVEDKCTDYSAVCDKIIQDVEDRQNGNFEKDDAWDEIDIDGNKLLLTKKTPAADITEIFTFVGNACTSYSIVAKTKGPAIHEALKRHYSDFMLYDEAAPENGKEGLLEFRSTLTTTYDAGNYKSPEEMRDGLGGNQ